MENIQKQTTETKKRRVHLDDGDCGGLTHYHGNDDYPDGANLPDPDFINNKLLDGKIANGNLDLMEEDDDFTENV